MPRSRLRDAQFNDADVLSETEHDSWVHTNLVTSGTLNFQDGTISGSGPIHGSYLYGNGSNVTNVNADTVDGQHASEFLSVTNLTSTSGVLQDQIDDISTVWSLHKHEVDLSSVTDTINLPWTVTSGSNISVYLDGVKQYPSTFTLISGSIVQLDETAPSGTKVYIANLESDAVPETTYSLDSDKVDGYEAVELLAGRKNYIINGNMHYAQRGTSFTGLSSGDSQYTLDRWKFGEGGAPTGVVDIKQTADHPLTPNGYCLEVDVTTSDTPAAADRMEIHQRIEGQFVQDLLWGTSDAKNIVISFWVKSYQTGNFAATIYNTDNTYSYIMSFTVNASNTWEQKTIVVPGLTSAGFLNDANVSLMLRIILMAGTDSEGAINTWVNNNYRSFSGATNILSSTDNNFRITDVQLEKGNVATPFENRLLGGLELSLCQRYFFTTRYPTFNMHTSSSGDKVTLPLWFPVTMRTKPPTVAHDAGSTVFSNFSSTASFSVYSKNYARMLFTASGASSNAYVAGASDSYIHYDAEL